MEPPSFGYDVQSDARLRGSSTSQPPPEAGASAARDDQDTFKLQSQLGHLMWEAGSKQVQDTFQSVGNIDVFRPYFNVEPVEVRSRLIRSFIPRKPSKMTMSPDLYGPSMVVLTMVALLLFNMKTSGYVVPNGTIMGTSMFACFGSWLSISSALYFICFLLGAEIPMLQLVSVFGYSLTSHCVVLLLSSLFHPSHDHLYFILLVLVFCAPSAIRMSLIVCMHARVPSHRVILAGCAASLHFLLIIYLHFGFHVMVEEIDSIIDGPAVELPNAIQMSPSSAL